MDGDTTLGWLLFLGVFLAILLVVKGIATGETGPTRCPWCGRLREPDCDFCGNCGHQLHIEMRHCHCQRCQTWEDNHGAD